MALVGLLVAAGSGERLGTGAPKAFVDCAGRPLLEWSRAVLASACDRVIVAVPPGLEDPSSGWVAGARSRSGSVRAALAAAPEAEVAVVHDAARPLVTRALVSRCVAALGEGWDGAVAAAPATDTLKEADAGDGRVLRTLRRTGIWVVQTPQCFRADALRAALAIDDATLAAASDDASLVEARGGRVRVVEAPPDNLKVTSPLDLRIAAALLAERERRGAPAKATPQRGGGTADRAATPERAGESPDRAGTPAGPRPSD